MNIQEAPFEGRIKVKTKEELEAMGITGGALLLEKGYYDTYFEMDKLSLENDTGTYRGTYYSGYHLHCKQLRISIECLVFDPNEYPEYFI